jgi:predicted phosphodiesterase
MRVQYCSDLHLEFRTSKHIPTLLKNSKQNPADVLILAGDICTMADEDEYNKFVEFIEFYHRKYKYIIHIPGNHEYYVSGKTCSLQNCMILIDKKMKTLRKIYPNYIYMNCNVINIIIKAKTYRFIGATLWSKVPKQDYAYIESHMNDYNSIYFLKEKQPQKYNVVEMQRLHSKHLGFLKKEIAQAKIDRMTCIVVTHHKPIVEQGDHVDRIDSAYSTDISSIMNTNVKLVVYGHTHKHNDVMYNGTRYVSNPRGYPNERTIFIPDIGIDIR